MIWRLLKNLVCFVLFACGLVACAQVDPPARLTQMSSGRSVHGKQGISHASASIRLFGSATQTPEACPPNTPKPDVFNTGSFWDHLRANFQIPADQANRPEVQQQIRWYVNHQQYLNRVITRAAPYMYYILQQTQQRNLPAELVLLPIMESAYNPFANSNRGAAGLWQLIHTTAYGFGVKQDWWYDGRRDIYASTNAALDYLTYLQSYFGGDWLLALASYDAGEGAVQMAVRRNSRAGKNTDFWSLQLPAETRSYVPRLLALAAIINNPNHYSIALPAITDQPYLQQVDLGAPINLAQAAQMANMSLADLKQLNPGYSHAVTGPNGPYKLLLPIDRIPTLKQNLALAPGLSQTTWGRYKVQHGETLSSIASRCHTTVKELCQENELKKHTAPVGKVIMVPTGTVYVKPHIVEDNTPGPGPAPAIPQVTAPAQQPLPNAPAPALEPQTMAPQTMAPADQNAAPAAPTINPNYMANINPSQNTQSAAPAPAAAPQQVVHVVQSKETLTSIAKRYGVKVSDLQRWNKLKAGKSVKVGTKLIILKPAAGTTSHLGTRKFASSRRGDTSSRNRLSHAAPGHSSPPKNILANNGKHHSGKSSALKKSSHAIAASSAKKPANG